ncbi:MAG TPA: hypothetical protein VGR35_00280 [Tepidisphaeraceae bacterium]|nr:hypothetical protein [Tepidisphaeraceae bacterium]
MRSLFLSESPLPFLLAGLTGLLRFFRGRLRRGRLLAAPPFRFGALTLLFLFTLAPLLGLPLALSP